MTYLLSHYLAEAVAADASRAAVVARDGSLTYGDLDRESDRVARALADAGIGRGDRVGLCLPKTHRAVAAMHGVLKAGASYVPVDPVAPAPRGAFILRDCAVRALVTGPRQLYNYREELGSVDSLDLVVLTDEGAGDTSSTTARVLGWSELPADGAVSCTPPNVETDPAYLLYTSGSTGKPKGVILSHRHALTFVDWAIATLGIGRDDRLSNHAPFHFDLSVLDIYAAMSAGASVHMVPDQVAPFPMELARWIEDESISVWYSVPSALVRMLLHGELERFTYSSLHTVLFAGEVFPIKYLRSVMERWSEATFWNLYGPTETNVCTYYRVPTELPEDATEIPIGRACENTDVFAVDDDGERVAAGGTGELLVRGPAVMHGYWGLAERTRQSLVTNPLQDAYTEPAYRTGDIVRLEDDGEYYFVGRRDHMVKTRGYRVELGEIEQVLHQHEAVHAAAVLAVTDDEVGARLHAAVAPVTDAELTPGTVREFCMERLPRYMVPESVVILTALPETSTGKIDRVALRDHVEDAVKGAAQ